MNLRHLEVFITVVECGSVTKASERLYIAQPSVSQTIADLEKEYNIKLFERLNKRLYLTEIGKTVYSKAKVLLKDFSLVDEILRDSSFINTIRVGASVTVGNCLLGSLLEKFQNLNQVIYNSVIVDNTEHIVKHILDGSLDVAIVEGFVDNENIIIKEICCDDVVLVGRADFDISCGVISNFIVREVGSGTRELALECLKASEYKYKNMWEISSTQAIIDLMKVNGCATGISKRLVNDKLNNGELKLLSDIHRLRHFYLIWHKDKSLTEVMQKFCDYACEHIK